MPGVFISYRRGGASAYAGRLYDRLTTEFGEENVFMDLTAIDPGTDFVSRIESAVGEADALLVVMGPEWVDAPDEAGRPRLADPQDFVHREVLGALERETLVVPVLVGGAVMPEADRLPPPLRPLARRNALELTDAGWSRDVTRLIETLRDRIRRDEEARATGRRRAGALGVVLAAVGGVALAIVLIGGNGGDDGGAGLSVASEVRVGGYAENGALSDGKLWTAVAGEGQLKIVTPGSDSPSDGPRVGTDLSGMAVADGRLFAGDYGGSDEDDRGTILEIDPETGRAVGRPIPTTDPFQIATDGRSLWVAGLGVGEVEAIDLETRRARKVDVEGDTLDVSVHDGTAWLVNLDEGELRAFDARTAEPRGRPIPVGSRPTGVAATGDSVWVATEQGRLVHVGSDGSRRGSVTVGGEGPRKVVADEQRVWVVGQEAVVTVDPRNLRVVGRLRLEGDLNDAVLDRAGAWVVRGRSTKASSVVRVVLEPAS